MRTSEEKRYAAYKNMGLAARLKTLEQLKTSINNLPEPKNPEQFAKTYKKMAEIALFLRNAQELDENEVKYAAETATSRLDSPAEKKTMVGKIIPVDNGYYLFDVYPSTDTDTVTDITPESLLNLYLQSVGNDLYDTAKNVLNAIEKNKLIKTIENTLPESAHINEILPGYDILRIAIIKKCKEATDITNADLLKTLVEVTFSSYEIAESDPKKIAKQTCLDKLRQKIQIESFKLLDIYKHALDHVEKNKKQLSLHQFTIEQEVPKQYEINASLLITSLDKFFKVNNNIFFKPVTNNDVQRSFMAMLADYKSTSSIEINLVLASYLEWIKRRVIDLSTNVDHTKDQDYLNAKTALIQGIRDMEAAERKLDDKHQGVYNTTFTELNEIATNPPKPALALPLKTLLDTVKELKEANKLPLNLLNKVLLQTNKAIKDNDWNSYSQFAKSLEHGKPTREKLALSCIMLTLCGVALGLACAGLIPVLPGAVLVGGLAVASFCSFFKNRPSGLHKATNQLVQAGSDHNPQKAP